MHAVNSTKRIFVAQNEPGFRDSLEIALRERGYAVDFARDRGAILDELANADGNIALVLFDAGKSGTDTQDTLEEIHRVDRQLPIVLLAPASSLPKLAQGIQNGPVELLTKPVNEEDLSNTIQRVLGEPHGASQRKAALDDRLPASEIFFSLSPLLKDMYPFLRQIGESDVPVLIQGESGVGKEVVARHVHALSPRATKSFLKLNCAALPSELLESELFGYERGAFTGAFKNKPGKFEIAQGGTILLDEIGDLDCRLQAKLLQVLQDHEFHRLGGRDVIRVDVRVMAATHCNLEEAMQQGRFREDLYYRLNVVNIELPPLRQRKDEILPLAGYFLKKHTKRGAIRPEITPALEQALVGYDWPGNIRELENSIRRLLVFGDPNTLVEELRLKALRRQTGPPLTHASPFAKRPCAVTYWPECPTLERVNEAKSRTEAEAILAALNSTHWNRKQAAALLNIDYRALLYKMRKLALS